MNNSLEWKVFRNCQVPDIFALFKVVQCRLLRDLEENVVYGQMRVN